MSEQDSHKSPEPINGLAIMPPEKIATSQLALEMAGKIAIDLVGAEDMNKHKLNDAFRTEYTLRRNELEHIAGHEEGLVEKLNTESGLLS